MRYHAVRSCCLEHARTSGGLFGRPDNCLRCQALPPVDRAAPDVLAALQTPLIIDVRDPDEIATGKGGPPVLVVGSTNVPLNVNGQKQSAHATTPLEFMEKLDAAGVTLSATRPIIVHCRNPPCGCGGIAAAILRKAGYDAYYGGGPGHIAKACGVSTADDNA